ncbi:polysaccharide biosynthesis protein GtrA [Bacillus sp. AFS002410]|uniref:GtrA family protein n=1 Tax=Bacillus sp. AFS002410 TaxID=2033481 RepID=UPI000BEFAE2E|nr:GtrA family protein [Bacillus sp. AFS002410]PEJ57158.1 polysaccharide biosynthesis protein GtrA [Bacillus sp. AFS002410]
MNRTFFRFIAVGVLNTIVGLSAIYLLLHLLGLSYWWSTFLGNTIGACVSYLLNRKFTFKSQSSVSKSVPLFIIVILVSYFIAYNLGAKIIDFSLSNTDFISDKMKTDLAVLISTGLYTIVNYFGQKLFVFHNKRENENLVDEEGI